MHYTGTIWRPPYEAASLLLEATAGCTHHRCKFCTLYSDLPFPFRMTPPETIESDLQEAQLLLTSPTARLARRLRGAPEEAAVGRVFLTGANPFVLSSEKLLRIAALVHTYLPSVESIGCFARVTDITAKSDAQLAALRGAGFDGLTIGIETADDEALRFMNKGCTAADILAQCQRLDTAGIRYHFFYLAGVSGAGRGAHGAELTAALCNELHPVRVGVNMLTIYPDSALFEEIARGNWREESEPEKYEEVKILAQRLTGPVILAAMGASNAFQFEAALPDERPQLLAALDAFLAGTPEPALLHYRQSVDHL